MNMNLSQYTNVQDAVGLQETVNATEVVSIIKSERLLHQTTALRTLEGQSYKAYKSKQLPAVTWSGTFSPKRNSQNLTSYSCLICLDIDHLDSESMPLLMAHFATDLAVCVAFVSPGGYGIKVVFSIVNNDPSEHKTYFDGLSKYVEKKYGVDVDRSGSDVSRLCILCHDPNVYHNPLCKPFLLPIEKPFLNGSETAPATESEVFEWCVTIHDRKNSFQPGQRNKYLVGLVNFANDYGISKSHIELECLKRFTETNFTAQEIVAVIKSIYNSKSSNHGSRKYAKKLEHSRRSIKAINTKVKDESAPVEKEVEEDKRPSVVKVEEFINSQWSLRYNIVTNTIEYHDLANNAQQFRELNEAVIYRALLHEQIRFSQANLAALLAADFVEHFDPFLSYFEELAEWDGVDYIADLASYIGFKDDEQSKRFEHHLRKWFVRVVACAIQPDYFNKQAIVFISEKQDMGKTSLCRFFAPKQLQNYQSEEFSLDKDGSIALAENLFIVLDELALMKRADINALKASFSRQDIKVRLPFAKRVSRGIRRASFVGSTNSLEFLNDETGSVRWLCFEIDSIDWSYRTGVDMDNIYAQAYALLLSGTFEYNLTRDEVKENEQANQRHGTVSVEQEMVQEHLIPASLEQHDAFMTATNLIVYLAGKTGGNFQTKPVSMGRAMQKLGFVRTQRYNGQYQVKGYYVSFGHTS